MKNQKLTLSKNLIWAALTIETCFLLLPRLALDFISLKKHLSNFGFQLANFLMLTTLIVELIALYALVWLLINCTKKSIPDLPKLVWVGLICNLLLLVLGDLFLWISVKNWPAPVFAYMSTCIIVPTTLIIMRWELAKSSAPFKALLTGHFVLITTSFMVVCLVAFWYFTAPPPGFCVVQNRFLTDAEYIEFVVPHELQRGQKIVDGKPVINCCSVDREGGVLRQVDDFTAKLFRLDKGVEVTWSYELSEEGKSMQFASPGDRRYVEIRVVDSCASQLLEQTGMATN